MLTRRQFIQGAATVAATGAGFGGYAFAIEPHRLVTQHYRVRPNGWPKGLKLRVAALADLHICEPWMPLDRVRQIVDQTNSLDADLVVMLGDFVGSESVAWGHYDFAQWAEILSQLKAPLGRHAVLGNHDWWIDRAAQARGHGPNAVAAALATAGVPVHENDAVRLEKDGEAFWLCGLGDQWAFYGDRDRRARPGTFGYRGVDDLAGTLAKVTDDAPVLMMVHEPDVFDKMPARVSLTMAGHTHGGQVQMLGYAPIIPSAFGRRFAYGHIQEADRHLIVSGGIGCSGLPVRFGRPPEIVVIDLEA